MIVGFTGTQVGMSENQKHALQAFLTSLLDKQRTVKFHHGGCVGADAEAAEIAHALGCEVFLHPPEDKKKFDKKCLENAKHVYPARKYRTRNQDIVNAAEVLIAAPKDEDNEEQRSGTWMTVRFGRKKGIAVVFLPRKKK